MTTITPDRDATITDADNRPTASIVPALALRPRDWVNTSTIPTRTIHADWARVTAADTADGACTLHLVTADGATEATVTLPENTPVAARINFPIEEGAARGVVYTLPVIHWVSFVGEEAGSSGFTWFRPGTSVAEAVDRFNSECWDYLTPDGTGGDYWGRVRLMWVPVAAATVDAVSADSDPVSDLLHVHEEYLEEWLPAVEREVHAPRA